MIRLIFRNEFVRLDSMSQIFLGILGLALLTWVGKYVFVLWYYRKQKEAINKLEARLAVLRMLLKAKLKRKGSQVQDQYRDEDEFLNTINAKLELLCTFNLNRPSDYSDIIDLLRVIAEAVDNHLVKKTPSYYIIQQKQNSEQKENLLKMAGVVSAEPTDQGQAGTASNEAQDKKEVDSSNTNELAGFDQWSRLLKYDKGNLYIIKEIIETTMDLKNRVEVYNSEQENKELHMRVPELIVIEGYEGLKNVVDLDQKHNKLVKSERKSKRKKDLVADPAADVADSTDDVA